MVFVCTALSTIIGIILSYIFFGLMGDTTWHYLIGTVIGLCIGYIYKKLSKRTTYSVGVLAGVVTFICLLIGNYLYLKNNVVRMPSFIDSCVFIMKSWYFSGFFKMFILILIPFSAYTTVVDDGKEEKVIIKSDSANFNSDDEYLDI